MELFFIVGAVTIVLILISYYAFSSSIFLNPKSCSRNRRPPEAGGAWPITGHLHIMNNGSPDKLPHLTLTAMAESYGPIFEIRLGARRAVIVSGLELVKEIYTTCDVAAASRPRIMSAEILGFNSAMFGFSQYGPYWRELRKLIAVDLLSSRGLHIQRHVLVSETAQSVRELYGLWNERKNASGSAPVEIRDWVGNLNLNAVLRIVVGKRYFVSGGDIAEARHCRKVLRTFFYLIGVLTIGDVLPYLRWLDLGGFRKKMKETSRELDTLAAKWLSEHRATAAADGKQEDFMDVMIGVVKSAKLGSEYDEDTIIKATCSNLISGSDTNTVMLVWSLSLLLNNPKELKKAQQELDEKVGRERRVELSDMSNLVYLEAIVKECLRLYPAAPLSAVREFSEDCNVGGYEIEKGTMLFVNIWKLQRDPQLWEEPDKFLPERFLTTAGHRDFQWIPFGGGRRICPGVNLALEMMKLVIANLVQGFDISTLDDEPVDMAGSFGLTISKAGPLNVLVSPRLPASLY
ncbi:cytochrome P450 CYP82D47-like [Andrographis paniculata]|uniref:cytochrome P450 CYP82D47-like n=1 Tax=Andrographis paniculata TaxID=175694 RepID=UPI0021E765C7|nr:cytochrome P450 CYP82D47-like [Andrographis paniculata]